MLSRLIVNVSEFVEQRGAVKEPLGVYRLLIN